MSNCAILGASGHGKVVADIVELLGYKEVHFFDDQWPHLQFIEHWHVRGTTNDLLRCCKQYDLVVVAIGNNATRLSKYKSLIASGARFKPLVHPSAIVSCYANIGEGTVVMAGTVVNPFSTIGKACIINTCASVDHDCVLGDGVHLSPGSHLAGGVTVGIASWIGIGASVKQLVQIENNATIASGATVIRDVLENETVAGVPAKVIKI